MESIQNTLQKISLKQFQNQSQVIQTSSDEISLYSLHYENKITEKVLIEQVSKILVAFPKIEPQMIELLKERFKANNFNDQRIIDAVNYVIDNYKGYDKLPSIADFIQYDKKAKTYTLSELKEKHKNDYYYGNKYDPIANEYIYLPEINRYIKKHF